MCYKIQSQNIITFLKTCEIYNEVVPLIVKKKRQKIILKQPSGIVVL